MRRCRQMSQFSNLLGPQTEALYPSGQQVRLAEPWVLFACSSSRNRNPNLAHSTSGTNFESPLHKFTTILDAFSSPDLANRTHHYFKLLVTRTKRPEVSKARPEFVAFGPLQLSQPAKHARKLGWLAIGLAARPEIHHSQPVTSNQ